MFNSSNISTQFIDSINTSLNIGTNTGTSLIQIGNATSNTSIIGMFNSSNISTHFIDSISNSAVTLWNTLTTGTAEILNANTGGIVNILCSAARTATTNIQTLSTQANIVNIGSANTTTNVSGLRATTIDSIGTAVLNLGSNARTTGFNFNNKVISNLTYGVNQFVTLSTNTANPGSTQLGYTSVTPTYTATGNFNSGGATKTLCAGQTITTGTYHVMLQTTIAITGGPARFDYIYIFIQNSVAALQLGNQIPGNVSSGGTPNVDLIVSLNGITVVPSGGETYTPVIKLPSTFGTFTTSATNFKFTWTRIA
jgi:hypothetical protein